MPSVAVHPDVVAKGIFMYMFRRTSETSTSVRWCPNVSARSSSQGLAARLLPYSTEKTWGPREGSNLLKVAQDWEAGPRLADAPGPCGLHTAAGSSRTKAVHSSCISACGHLGRCLPCGAAVFASAACWGPLSWTRGLQRPFSEAGDLSLSSQDGGHSPTEQPSAAAEL